MPQVDSSGPVLFHLSSHTSTAYRPRSLYQSLLERLLSSLNSRRNLATAGSNQRTYPSGLKKAVESA